MSPNEDTTDALAMGVAGRGFDAWDECVELARRAWSFARIGRLMGCTRAHVSKTFIDRLSPAERADVRRAAVLCRERAQARRGAWRPCLLGGRRGRLADECAREWLARGVTPHLRRGVGSGHRGRLEVCGYPVSVRTTCRPIWPGGGKYRYWRVSKADPTVITVAYFCDPKTGTPVGREVLLPRRGRRKSINRYIPVGREKWAKLPTEKEISWARGILVDASGNE